MSLNLSSFKVALDELSSSTKFDALVQAIQDAANNLGDPAYGAFAPGKIFDLSKIKQGGATPGQVLAWQTSNQWAPQSLVGGEWTLIADSTLGADTASFSFTSIPGTFRHLALVLYLRSDRAATTDTVGMRFNNDTAGNYDSYFVRADSAGPTDSGVETFAGTSMNGGDCTGNTATANVFSAHHFLIPHYAQAVNNKCYVEQSAIKFGTGAGNLRVDHAGGFWRSAVAITRIDLLPTSGGANWKSGSRATLYGL